jgi:hypothetical protein
MSSTTNLSVPKNAESDSISITTLPITGKRKAAAINKALNEVKLKKRKLREELFELTKRSTELEGWLFQQKVKRLEDMYKKKSLQKSLDATQKKVVNDNCDFLQMLRDMQSDERYYHHCSDFLDEIMENMENCFHRFDCLFDAFIESL